MSYMNANTSRLDGYTTRIRNVLTRMDKLHGRVRKLYLTGEVKGLWELYRYNHFSSGRNKVANCRTYINNTISELNNVERYLATRDPLSFVRPSGNLISPTSKADRNGKNDPLAFIRSIINPTVNMRERLENLKRVYGAIVSEASKEFFPQRDTIEKILDYCAKAAKAAGKIGDNEENSMFAGVLGLAKEIYGFITGDDNAYIGAIKLFEKAGKTYEGICKFVDKSLNSAKEVFSKFPGLQSISMFTNSLGFSSKTLEAYASYLAAKGGDGSWYDFASKTFSGAVSGVDFGGSIYMFWNAWEPGQVQILTDGTITNGYVLNTEFLKNGAVYMKIVDGYGKAITSGISKYGEANVDGKVTCDEWTSIVAESGVQGLNKMLLFGIIPDEAVDAGMHRVESFIDDWGHSAATYIQEHENYKEFSEKNGFCNLLARVAACRQVANDSVTSWLRGIF